MKTFLKSSTAIVTLIGAMGLMTGAAEARNLHAGAKHEVSQDKQAKAEAKAAAKDTKVADKQAKADARAIAKQAKADDMEDEDGDALGGFDEGDDVVASDDQGGDVASDDNQGDDTNVEDQTDVEGVGD